MNTNKPKNAQEAMALALRHERALQIIKEGLYTFHKDANSEVVAVCKPNSTAATYWINLMEPGCDCPDAMKGNDCKHEIAYDLLQAEAAAAADEEASMAWQCMIWEDQNLPMLPELPKLAKDVVNRMEADLTRTQDAIAQHGVHRTNFIQAQQDRNKAARLENALVIVNQYRSLPLCKECGSELPFCLCTQPDGPTFMNEVL